MRPAEGVQAEVVAAGELTRLEGERHAEDALVLLQHDAHPAVQIARRPIRSVGNRRRQDLRGGFEPPQIAVEPLGDLARQREARLVAFGLHLQRRLDARVVPRASPAAPARR